jgi:hypothetical protein
MSLFVPCTWQTNTTNFTKLHSHSTCPFYFQKSYSIFGAEITQFGKVTGQGLDSQPIWVWILAEARNLSLLIALNSSRGTFPGGKAKSNRSMKLTIHNYSEILI